MKEILWKSSTLKSEDVLEGSFQHFVASREVFQGLFTNLRKQSPASDQLSFRYCQRVLYLFEIQGIFPDYDSI
jgi:hypothetical protein